MEDEFSLIDTITPKSHHQSSLVKGIGDDAALYLVNEDEEQIVCLDTMVETVHFTKRTMDAYHIGWKALASNISDIAAMGGQPTFYLVSIALPEAWKSDFKAIYQGMSALADMFNMDLIGGDTTSSPKHLVITVTVIGKVKRHEHLLRSMAKPGDCLCVTGTLGDSAAGLQLLMAHGKDFNYKTEQKELVRAHQQPIPQVLAASILSKNIDRYAVNDISDGIASEAYEIAEASQVSLMIDYEKLPQSSDLAGFPAKDREDFVLRGGEDYQLLLTVPRERMATLSTDFQTAGIKMTKIGSVEAGPPKVQLIKGPETKKGQETILLEKRGYNHFGHNK